MPAHEVERKLNRVAREMLSDDIETNLVSKLFTWLANQMQRVTVWATVRAAVAACSTETGGIDLRELRERLAPRIDEWVDAQLRDMMQRTTVLAMGAVSVVVLLVALFVRRFV